MPLGHVSRLDLDARHLVGAGPSDGVGHCLLEFLVDDLELPFSGALHHRLVAPDQILQLLARLVHA